MQFLGLAKGEREALLAGLAEMPDFLERALGGLSPAEALAPGANGTFSPVEQSWHLADLERDGYATRIRRLLSEADPLLADFDGERVAAERQYRTLSLTDGLRAFREARLSTLALLRQVAASDWERPGRQEGVGALALCDVPAMMAAHDTSHRSEIEAWLRERH